MRFLTFLFCFFSATLFAQKVPAVYSGIHYDDSGRLYYQKGDQRFYAKTYKSFMSLDNMKGHPKGTKSGLKFDFGNSEFSGTLYYGFYDFSDSKHPTPVWYKRVAKIRDGEASINIKKRLSGIYDMVDWQEKGRGTLGYRVANKKGELLYDGIVSFRFNEEAGFSVTTTVVEGPFVSDLQPTGTTIWFETNQPVSAEIHIGGKVFADVVPTTKHEITVTGLMPNTQYEYSIKYEDVTRAFSFKTAPESGSRQPFVFAYVSDSRAGQGGGERNLYGTNFYAMRKITALAHFNQAAFMQFTGDLVNGYSIDKKDINVQYANWKRAVEPFGHYFPIVAGVGNHEVNGTIFVNEKGKSKGFVTDFPFESESSAAIFAQNFVNPKNGPISEDGSIYDPNPNVMDFPPYDETVFYYVYDNVAMVVLNSDYFYAPSISRDGGTGGNLHGYIMDNQLAWLDKTIAQLDGDPNIDHVFVTQHTPTFPNSAHVKDDMWYNGNNAKRPTIAGTPVKKGIIERRDEYLDILINKSDKVVAILTGDEHNYNKVEITPDVNIYPPNYAFPKFERKRSIWQINNGSAGAPYYAQDTSTPWSDEVTNFSTQLALVLFYVDGAGLSVKVYNPDTLELMDEYVLRD